MGGGSSACPSYLLVEKANTAVGSDGAHLSQNSGGRGRWIYVSSRTVRAINTKTTTDFRKRLALTVQVLYNQLRKKASFDL